MSGTGTSGGVVSQPTDKQDNPADEDDNRRWYVIHTYSGYENRVCQNLLHRIESMEMQAHIFRVIVPTEETIEIKNGKRRTVQRKVLPGYVLVQMRLSDDAWYVVRHTPGVTSFVGVDGVPTPLGEAEVKAILRLMDQDAPKRLKISYQVGENVTVTDGPFESFEGKVSAIDHERGRVRVLVSFFGRDTSLELDFLQVTPRTDQSSKEGKK